MPRNSWYSNNGTPWGFAEKSYQRFRQRIRHDRDEFVKLAEVAYDVWPLRKAQRHEDLERFVGTAKTMKLGGFRIKEIMEGIDRSERTVYRYLAKA